MIQTWEQLFGTAGPFSQKLDEINHVFVNIVMNSRIINFQAKFKQKEFPRIQDRYIQIAMRQKDNPMMNTYDF